MANAHPPSGGGPARALAASLGPEVLVGLDALLRDLVRVLRAHDDRVDAHRARALVLDRDLRLAVRAQVVELTRLADLGQPQRELVRERDRQRHELRRLVAGVAEHQALVARALVEVQAAALIDALRDIGRLRVVGDEHGTTLVVDAVVGVVVADALDGVARHLDVVHMRVGGDFTGQHHQTGVAQGLGRDSAAGVLGENGIQNRIRNLIRDLIGMAFGDRFASEKTLRHWKSLTSARPNRATGWLVAPLT